MTLSVSELNEYVRRSLASDPIIHNISIKGEVSNFKSYASGHWYFTLKDENAAISCVMFRQNNTLLDFLPNDGMSVELLGTASLYVKTGQYQFYVEDIKESGIGVLYQKFEELKKKLFNEGLFDDSLKRPLPFFVKNIGVISSSSGAVIHDIINVTQSRNNLVSITLFPSKVQGEGTAENVIKGIEYFNSKKCVDLIIIARGGGSFEDLFEFNDEKLARKARASLIPIISAIGHETDFTILDFVSDRRAATPSQAAEIAVVKLEDIIFKINQFNEKANLIMSDLIEKYSNDINTIVTKLNNINILFQSLSSRLLNLQSRLDFSINKILKDNISRLDLAEQKLKVYDPKFIMSKGYAIIKKNNKIINSISLVEKNDTLDIKLYDGDIITSVQEVNNDKKINDI